MDKKILAYSHKMKDFGMRDDDYTLYEDGTVIHFYDASIYPGQQNKTVNLTVDKLTEEVKIRLYEAASSEFKEKVANILKLRI